jgi:acyl CoA:acetate/3-ketoacid CoA transferase beta subunit
MTTPPPSAVAPSSTEFLAAVAARQLAGKTRVFAGVGLPTLAVDLARRTINPGLELVYESGVCGAHPEALAEGIADSVLVSGAEAVISMHALFGYVLQGGHIDVGFLGAAQVDRWGSLNTSIIGDWDKPSVRLPGAGGATEIMPNAGECIVVTRPRCTSATAGLLHLAQPGARARRGCADGAPWSWSVDRHHSYGGPSPAREVRRVAHQRGTSGAHGPGSQGRNRLGHPCRTRRL